MSPSRKLKIPCILPLILPQASFSTTVVCHVVQAPGILNDVQFFRPLLMLFPPPTMPFQSSPLGLYLNFLHGIRHVTSSMKDFPTPGWSHIPCSLSWNLWRSPLRCPGGLLTYLPSSCDHMSLNSVACASQQALQSNQTRPVITEPLAQAVCPSLFQ